MPLTDAVAQAAFKLMAYKDEYEVARLHTDGRFAEAITRQFTGKPKVTYHLAPPLMSPRDPVTGRLRKREFGGWIRPLLKGLAGLKGLRGSALDIFGYTAERKLQRRLIGEYEVTVKTLLTNLSLETHALAAEIAALPLEMRGFGHVLEANVEKVKAREADLLAAYLSPLPTVSAAE
jgi:indolepyruvate ferredoxin oxidoreductase